MSKKKNRNKRTEYKRPEMKAAVVNAESPEDEAEETFEDGEATEDTGALTEDAKAEAAEAYESGETPETAGNEEEEDEQNGGKASEADTENAGSGEDSEPAGDTGADAEKAPEDFENREPVSEEVFFDADSEEREMIDAATKGDSESKAAQEEGEEPRESKYSEEAREEFEKAQKQQKENAKKSFKERSESIEKSREYDEKRAARHARRIRNQIISYVVIFAFLAIICGGGAFLVKHFLIDGGVFSKKAEEPVITEEQQEQIEELVGEEEELEPVITEEPVTEAPSVEELPEILEPVITEEPVNALDEYVDGLIASMSLEDKVSGIIMTSPEALTKVTLATVAGDGTRAALENYKVGGIVYAAKNVTSHDQFRDMMAGTLTMVDDTTFLAIAEEGGNNASPVAKVDFYETALRASEVAETNDVANAYNVGSTIGTALKALGLNLDLAPIADLSSDAPESLDGRTYGSDAGNVLGYVSSMEDGLESAGVTACLKYFPGQGYAGANPEFGRTVINKTEEEYRKGDFLVYEACIQNGTKMIMMSNAVVAAFDDSQPATLSEAIVTGILRNELGFDGVILSGNLGDVAIGDYYTVEDAAVNALKAGCDMLYNPTDFETAYNAIISAVGDGVISEERINDALRRIYRIKYADKV